MSNTPWESETPPATPPTEAELAALDAAAKEAEVSPPPPPPPATGETPPPPPPPVLPSALDLLKTEADGLGIVYATNIGEATLTKRIAEHKVAPPVDTPPEPELDGEPQTSPEVPAVIDTIVPSKPAVVEAPVVEVAAPAKQAPLALVNLISQGMSMRDAKAKLGITD